MGSATGGAIKSDQHVGYLSVTASGRNSILGTILSIPGFRRHCYKNNHVTSANKGSNTAQL